MSSSYVKHRTNIGQRQDKYRTFLSKICGIMIE
nr:MAG TPA: hypothetical protein [Caudoviricetes sp.]